VIAFLAAATTAAAIATAAPAAPPLAPSSVVAGYTAALAHVREPGVFAFEYAMVQTGPRTLEQRHRVFRSGRDERDETLAVNGVRPVKPVVRIFRNRPYRYSVAALAPRPAQYDFVYAGPHKSGKHTDYVFTLVPKSKTPGFAFTQVTIDGLTFLPQSVAFSTAQHGGRGLVSFAKIDRYWVARTATARADVAGGVAREQIAFSNWRFPKTLPRSTFALPRPLPPALAPLP
jgi:hypothetical protein